MKQKFTQQHLLKYIYKETSATETLAIQDAINKDWDLNEQHDELKAAYQQLPKVQFSPSKRSLQNILRYSKENSVETSF